jgi:S1-C subfamily serine protease
VDCPRWDFTVKEINQFDNPDLYFYRKKGVFVFGIKSPGNAQRTGLSPQDVILKINGTNVETLDDVKAIHAKALKGVAKKHKIVLTTMRGGLTRVVVLDFARDYARD